jgi:hypothetical protein
MIVAGAGVIGMGVRDHCAIHRTVRVDVESARPAIEAARIDSKPGLEALRMHAAH